MKTYNLLRRVASTIREMNDAVKLSTEYRLSREIGFGDEAPDTYAEFLLRTSVTSVHEPSAARRSCRC
jgi:hypothetical protein